MRLPVVSSITWARASNEAWHGFTVGTYGAAATEWRQGSAAARPVWGQSASGKPGQLFQSGEMNFGFVQDQGGSVFDPYGVFIRL
jgi:hypothetical protein